MVEPLPGTLKIASLKRSVQVVDIPSVSITVKSGTRKGWTGTLSLSRIRIGKSPENDLVLTDLTVSRFHATIDLTSEGLVLTDLQSTNGTFIRGVRVKQVVMAPLEEIQLGEVTLEVSSVTREQVAELDEQTRFHGLVGQSLVMRELFALIRAVAGSRATVLVLGETGTGKEMVSRAIHAESGCPGELVVFDCASTQGDLIRSELFGHTKGAFTGASGESRGACRTAHKGTLFLDEIGELPLELQPNLLRVLETREVKPLGSERPVLIDVRVVAATHRDLREQVLVGTFRQDLYHRLSVIEITVPPLRDRPEDIPGIMRDHLEERGLSLEFSPEALEKTLHHSWPGNVRELKNALERLTLVAAGRPVTLRDLEFLEQRGALATREPASRRGTFMPSIDRQSIEEALRAHQGNRDLAARALGISRATLYRRLREFRQG